jgi:hypothetical protein
MRSFEQLVGSEIATVTSISLSYGYGCTTTLIYAIICLKTVDVLMQSTAKWMCNSWCRSTITVQKL